MVFFRCTTYAVPVSGGVCPVVRSVECRLTACLFPVNLFDIKNRPDDVSVPVEACVRRWSGADGAHADVPFMARSMAVSAYIIRYQYDKKSRAPHCHCAMPDLVFACRRLSVLFQLTYRHFFPAAVFLLSALVFLTVRASFFELSPVFFRLS